MDNRNKAEQAEQLKKLEEELENEEGIETIADLENKDTEDDVELEEDTTEDEEEVEEDDTEEETEDEDDTDDPNYEEKFKHSTREAQILTSKHNKFVSTVDEAANIPMPSDEQLQEYAKSKGVKLTEENKVLVLDSYINNARFEKIHGVVEETRKIDEWADKVDAFVEDETMLQQFPGLAGREKDFRSFCMKPTRRGADLEDAAKAFLFDTKNNSKKSKESLLLTGSKGKGMKPKKTTLDEEGAINTRATSQKKYKEMIKSGKVDIDL